MSAGAARRRVLVVSHPCVVTANQSIYAALLDYGWEVTLVVPARWRHEYSSDPFAPKPLAILRDRFITLPIVGAGLPQRHAYRARLSPVIQRAQPEVAFLEQEPFAVPSLQWARALRRAGVPYGLQADENLDRSLPLPAVLIQRQTLTGASFVSARSPTAQQLIETLGYQIDVRVVPHAVPEWPSVARREGQPFTVGFAGRLIPEKGVEDLVAATAMLDPAPRVRMYGNGPLRDKIRAGVLPGQDVEVITDLAHERMADAFAEMDVLVLPSRTTSTWAEQFGRVLVEAMWCGVPVIGSDSGEIPWVIETTGGGLLFPEGDRAALADRLATLRERPDMRETLARQGRRTVQARFSVRAAARAFDEQLRQAVLPAVKRSGT